jgi:hypothetical protein
MVTVKSLPLIDMAAAKNEPRDSSGYVSIDRFFESPKTPGSDYDFI